MSEHVSELAQPASSRAASQVVMSGVIGNGGIGSILQLVNLQRNTVQINMTSNDDATQSQRGTLYYVGGQLQHVKSQTADGRLLEGTEALGKLLSVATGHYEVVHDPVANHPITIRGQHEQVLLAALVQIDENGPDAPRPPEFDPNATVDVTKFFDADEESLLLLADTMAARSTPSAVELPDVTLSGSDVPHLRVNLNNMLLKGDEFTVLSSVNGRRSLNAISNLTLIKVPQVSRILSKHISTGTLEIREQLVSEEFWASALSLTTQAVGPAALLLLKNACKRLSVTERQIPLLRMDEFLKEVVDQIRPERQHKLRENFEAMQRELHLRGQS